MLLHETLESMISFCLQWSTMDSIFDEKLRFKRLQKFESNASSKIEVDMNLIHSDMLNFGKEREASVIGSMSPVLGCRMHVDWLNLLDWGKFSSPSYNYGMTPFWSLPLHSRFLLVQLHPLMEFFAQEPVAKVIFSFRGWYSFPSTLSKEPAIHLPVQLFFFSKDFFNLSFPAFLPMFYSRLVFLSVLVSNRHERYSSFCFHQHWPVLHICWSVQHPEILQQVCDQQSQDDKLSIVVVLGAIWACSEAW